MARRPASRKKHSKPAPAKRAGSKKPAKVASKPAAKSGQWVYIFGGGKAQGRSGMRDLLGGKGANLAEMANLGLPVPPGFTITTAVCTHYYANKNSYPKALEQQSGDPRFAYDSYRRFIQMYSNVVLDIEHHNFEDILEEHKSRAGHTLDTDLTAEDW